MTGLAECCRAVPPEMEGLKTCLDLPRHCEEGLPAKEVLLVVYRAVRQPWEAAHYPMPAMQISVVLPAASTSRYIVLPRNCQQVLCRMPFG